MKTSSASLQAKLDSLAALAAAGDKLAFVNQFVPLDLTPDELATCATALGGTAGSPLALTPRSYAADLEKSAEGWAILVAEVAALASGETVTKIEGDQVTRAEFFFRQG